MYPIWINPTLFLCTISMFILSFFKKFFSNINKIIEEVIKDCGASSMKDMGQVIGVAISKMKGKGEGSIVSQLVREKLS